jgi:hypothetical protein
MAKTVDPVDAYSLLSREVNKQSFASRLHSSCINEVYRRL